MRYTHDGERMPGSDRDRPKFRNASFPTIAGELVDTVSALVDPKKPAFFPFKSWASANLFRYPPEALDTLCQCESAAEAFFARGFFEIPAAERQGVKLNLQVKVGFYRIDAVASNDRCKLAIEIDGLTFHARKYDQVAADYLRERRIVCAGYTLIRFTAQDVFKTTPECWRQVIAILAARPFPSPT